MQMRFSGKFTEAELKDVRLLVRTRMYWPRLVLKNLYGLLLLVAIIWATVVALVGAKKPKWVALAAVWIVIAAIVIWAVYRSRKAFAKELAGLNATLPDTLTFESGGVRLELPAGVTAFHPWRSFSGWREGEHVVLLDKQDKHVLMVPLTALPETDRESLRQLLRTSIAARSTTASATK